MLCTLHRCTAVSVYHQFATHRTVSCTAVPQGYAYILTHPGTPTVFYDHFYQEQDNLRKHIADLLGVRRRNGINARSKVRWGNGGASLSRG